MGCANSIPVTQFTDLQVKSSMHPHKVRVEHLGDIDDLERAELRLLARLQDLGYQVERGRAT